MKMLPKLGNVNSHWGQQNGQPVLVMQNALGLSPSAIALPQTIAMLPLLCDGTRDVGALRASLMIRAGVQISEEILAQIIQQMDQALLFENGLLPEAMAHALNSYRQAESRSPVSADFSYPSDPTEAAQFLDAFLRLAAEKGESPTLPEPAENIRGIVSPHIDYQRGGAIYAGVWGLSQPAVEQADLVVILGTDHHGPTGSVTLTRQSYQSPWGIIETDREGVDHVVEFIGEDAAFAHELHHSVEHSVELALVWLHHITGEARFTALPILCGSFGAFVDGTERVEECREVTATIEALRSLADEGRRVLFVAAVDFAHMGPAFDGHPMTHVNRAACRATDEGLLEAICAGDAEGFLAKIQAEGDRRNVCGTPPLYIMLRAMEGASGVVTGYEQCPADQRGTSLVSIAGALLW